VSGQGVILQYSAGIWMVLSDDLPLAQLDGLFLQSAHNLSDVASPSTALANLGGATLSQLDARYIPIAVALGG
jgi:hypothetical protein